VDETKRTCMGDAALMHGMAVEGRAESSKGAGVSVGEAWTRQAVDGGYFVL